MDVGVIGTGIMGKNHIRVYNELKNVDTIRFYDKSKQSMNDVDKLYVDQNVFRCYSLEELVNSVDVISICTPTQFHIETVNNIIKSGDGYIPDLLIEKPLCNLDFNLSIIKTISDKLTNIIVGVGHIERFNPIIPEIAKIIKDPLYIEFKRHNPSSSRLTGTNVIEDLMIHDIDIMREYFCSSPISINAFGDDNICDVGIKYHYPIHLSASRKSSKKIRSIYIEMEEFTLEADYMTQEITIYSKPERFKLSCGTYNQENMVEKVSVRKVEPLKEELKTFINCSINRTEFPVSLKDALNNIEICKSIRESCRCNMVV